jgi:hypothetical protein
VPEGPDLLAPAPSQATLCDVHRQQIIPKTAQGLRRKGPTTPAVPLGRTSSRSRQGAHDFLGQLSSPIAIQRRPGWLHISRKRVRASGLAVSRVPIRARRYQIDEAAPVLPRRREVTSTAGKALSHLVVSKAAHCPCQEMSSGVVSTRQMTRRQFP